MVKILKIRFIRMTVDALTAALLLLLIMPSAYSAGDAKSGDDRQAISDLIADYAYRWDRKDAAAFSKLFSSNGAIDVWVAGKVVEGTRVEGRDNILAYARKAHAERIGKKQSRHHFTSLIFRELNATRAITEHMLLVTHQAPGQKLEMITSGYYKITWSKLDDNWLIEHRTLYLDR